MTTTKDDVTSLSMKLLIDRKGKRLLFAEASKEVVDFLFCLLSLPVATAVKLVGKDDMVGCVGNLYASVEKLDSTYVQPGAAKDALLCPAVLSPAAGAGNCSLLRLSAPQPSLTSQTKTLYECGYCINYVTNVYGTCCPSCGRAMLKASALKSASPESSVVSGQQTQNVATTEEGAKWFVQGIVTYTVTDDLIVSPVSAISGITSLLTTFGVTDIGDLEEKTVHLGFKEGVAILKASLQSETVLTDVFLGKKQTRRRAI